MIEHIEQGTLDPNIRACIALTSWKKRINTVGLTIYNLFETCGPDYHIVLTLAEEEFPKKEQELPKDLVLMNRVGMFEILWVKNNWKSFKKWVFCSIRFPKVPVISADDDCIYKTNYVDKLYVKWQSNRNSIITNDGMPNDKYGISWGRGPNTLYPPCFAKFIYNDNILKKLLGFVNLDITEDDSFYGWVAHLHNIHIIDIGNPCFYVFHDTIDGLTANRKVDFATSFNLYQSFLK